MKKFFHEKRFLLIMLPMFLLLSCANKSSDQNANQVEMADEFTENFNAAQLDTLFDSITEFEGGFAVVRNPSCGIIDTYGMINKKGELVLPCVYNCIFDISDGIAVVRKMSDDLGVLKCGYANANGLITSVFYDRAGPFIDGMGMVKQDGKRGFVNSEGKEIIPCIYDEARSFADGLAPVKKDGKWGYINKKGEIVLPFIYKGAGPFEEGEALVTFDNGSQGLINLKGEVIVTFDAAEIDDASISRFSNDPNEPIIAIKPGAEDGGYNDKYGLFNRQGKLIVPFIYDQVSDFFDGLARVIKNNKIGYINTKGEEVIPCIYDIGFRFSEDLALVVKEGSMMFINKEGEVVLSDINSKYENDDRLFIPEFSNGLALVMTKDGKRGFIDKAGKEVIPCVYDMIEFINPVGDGGIAQIQYADYFYEGIACVKKDGKWGYINTKGEEVIPFKYEEAKLFSEGLAPVKKDGIWGYVDTKGNDTFKGVNYEKILKKKYGDNVAE